MNKKKILLLVFVVVTLCLVVFVLARQYIIKPQSLKTTTPVCKDRAYSIPLILQSGEKGTLYLTGNSCSAPLANSDQLVFSVFEDGAVRENIFDSRLYIWLRDANLSIEQQIESILSQRYKKHNCAITKNVFTQHDNLSTYRAANGECIVFGGASDFSSEIYMETNGLLIAQRQDGFDGIEPFNVASIRFVED